eukprot:gene1835-1115_t
MKQQKQTQIYPFLFQGLRALEEHSGGVFVWKQCTEAAFFSFFFFFGVLYSPPLNGDLVYRECSGPPLPYPVHRTHACASPRRMIIIIITVIISKDKSFFSVASYDSLTIILLLFGSCGGLQALSYSSNGVAARRHSSTSSISPFYSYAEGEKKKKKLFQAADCFSSKKNITRLYNPLITPLMQGKKTKMERIHRTEGAQTGGETVKTGLHPLTRGRKTMPGFGIFNAHRCPLLSKTMRSTCSFDHWSFQPSSADRQFILSPADPAGHKWLMLTYPTKQQQNLYML